MPSPGWNCTFHVLSHRCSAFLYSPAQQLPYSLPELLGNRALTYSSLWHPSPLVTAQETLLPGMRFLQRLVHVQTKESHSV